MHHKIHLQIGASELLDWAKLCGICVPVHVEGRACGMGPFEGS